MSGKSKTSKRKFPTERSSSMGKHIDWQAVLKDLDFIKKKVDEACQEQQRQPVINVRKIYGEERSIETIHDLYRQVLQLFRQNNLLKEEIKKFQMQLVAERRRREEAEMNLLVLREENKRIQSEFIRSTTPVTIGRSTPIRMATPTKMPYNQTSQTTIPERIKGNLIVFKKEPQAQLNEEFEELFKLSSREKNPSTKTKIRRELLRVTEQIKKIAKMDHSFL